MMEQMEVCYQRPSVFVQPVVVQLKMHKAASASTVDFLFECNLTNYSIVIERLAKYEFHRAEVPTTTSFRRFFKQYLTDKNFEGWGCKFQPVRDHQSIRYWAKFQSTDKPSCYDGRYGPPVSVAVNTYISATVGFVLHYISQNVFSDNRTQ